MPAYSWRDREQPQLQGGDDAEAAAAAAQRPEQVGLVLAVRAAELAVGGHHLDRPHVAGRQAVLAAQEAHAAAQGVPGDADIPGRARKRGQPVPGRGLHDAEPHRARLHARGPRQRIDLDAVHPVGLEQDGVRQRPERHGVVPGALGRDPLAVVRGERGGSRDVVRRFGKYHRGRVLVGGEVERLPGVAETWLAGQHDLPGKPGRQPARVPRK